MGDEHLAGPDGPPAAFVHSCGELLDPLVVCAHCGAEAAPQTLRAAD